VSDAVNILLNEEGNKHFGKKYGLHGLESLSFSEIDIIIKNTYSNGNIVNTNDLLKFINTQLQLFFHGNTHITNATYFLDHVNKKIPQFGSENLELQTRSFDENYANKKGNTSKDDLKLPHVHRYWDISLD
jgi:hypothetical protein